MASIGTLGKPYRIIYTAKNFATGLTGVTCRVIRPDLALSALNPMTEFEDTDLKGCYYFDFETSENDPLGDYIVIINNSQQAHKEGYRISYQHQAQGEALETIMEGLTKHYFGN